MARLHPRLVLLVGSVVCFVLDVVLIAMDSTSAKAEALLVPLGLALLAAALL